MGFRLSEHQSLILNKKQEESDNVLDSNYLDTKEFEAFSILKSKPFNDSSFRYIAKGNQDFCTIKADYCVGLDWLGESKRTIYVEPKLNAKLSTYYKDCLDLEESESDVLPKNFEFEEATEVLVEVDYLRMLLEVMSNVKTVRYTQNLIQVDWEAKEISIEQKDDQLTPFLVVQFLQLLKTIVKKGLKKSYYKVEENLNNKIKGKILVGQNIKKNVFKNRMTSTFCEYQIFGEDYSENRFLKKVLQFVSSYVENNKEIFNNNFTAIINIQNYCRPAFQNIGNELNERELKHLKTNAFFKEYKEAIKIGQSILKKFSYNITKTTLQKVDSPPFWIDMPSLFELYFYNKLLIANPSEEKHIHFQFSTYGNSLDFLISKSNFEMVIDTKYKMHYNKGQIHDDIRQVSGYARLKKVRKKLKLTVEDDSNIECLIIYPLLENTTSIDFDFSLENIKANYSEIKAYHKVYKLGIKLPII